MKYCDGCYILYGVSKLIFEISKIHEEDLEVRQTTA